MRLLSIIRREYACQVFRSCGSYCKNVVVKIKVGHVQAGNWLHQSRVQERPISCETEVENTENREVNDILSTSLSHPARHFPLYAILLACRVEENIAYK